MASPSRRRVLEQPARNYFGKSRSERVLAQEKQVTAAPTGQDGTAESQMLHELELKWQQLLQAPMDAIDALEANLNRAIDLAQASLPSKDVEQS